MIDRICKNCKLFNDKDNVCAVTVVVRGEHYELPVLPYDNCHWERVDVEVQERLKDEMKKGDTYFQAKIAEELESPIEIKQIRMWSDGKNGYIQS